MNLCFIHAIILFAFLLVHNCFSSIISKQFLLNLAEKSPGDPFLKCIQQHTIATCCWRFPEIDDCPSEEEDEEQYDEENKREEEKSKSGEKKNENFLEDSGDKEWQKQYGDEFFS
ncbi:hypothetical protein niasHT_012975 [Heterodera trifolii]|uniref:Secreted protein n=1 Tax=Heterodera trifolii TaxID=157864 RepID=A0ABD2L3P0_9BILA